MTCEGALSTLFVGALLFSITNVGCGDDDAADDSGASDHDGGVDAGNLDASMNMNIDSAPPDSMVQAPDVLVIPPDSGPAVVGDTWGLTSNGRLALFERASGKLERAVHVAVPTGEVILGADVRPADGTIIALTNVGKLYSVNRQTGDATLKSTLVADPTDTVAPLFTALDGTAHGVDFNPVSDRLRVISNAGQNLRVDVDTGATSADLVITPAAPGIAAAAYTNSFSTSCRTNLYVLDAATRTLFLQNPPNDGKLAEVGSLGSASIGEVHGFEILVRSNGENVALVAATAADGERVSELNLTTGALASSHVVALDSGEKLASVFALPPASAPAQPVGELIATTADSKLISFMRGSPGKLCTSVAISGLSGSQDIVGADVRPADGHLYALASNGNLYTIAPVTGAATLKSTLVKGSGEDPFVALGGGEYAVGFNPVADRLRIISDTGVNLRVNVDDGKVTTDSPITQATGTPGVAAIAYTNAFAGARWTTLWGIDSTSHTLVRIGARPADTAACPNATNPNCGVSTTVQPLGIAGDVAAVNGFDVQATTGIAMAALTVDGAASSTLYTINLNGNPAATPAVPVVTARGVIAGGARVRSLSFAGAPKLTAWAVTADNKLISFAPTAPQTNLSNAALSGLQPNETLIGIDVRPADGKLYGVGSTGRLYTLAPDGTASEKARLTPAIGVTFSALRSSSYGFDFNPAVDVLRLVDREDDNLRILPSARTAGALGATFVDSALNPTGAMVVAAGFSNNFAGAASSTLYVMGGAVTTLYRQGGLSGEPSPNGGALTTVGALGFNSALDIGFDIVGGNNGLALAALDQAGAATLYSVNLISGAATPYNTANNTIANASGPLRGFTLELK